MSANLKAYVAFTAASEGVKQADISAAAGSGDEYNVLVKAATVAHWTRCAEEATKRGINAPVYSDALRFHARGV
jgi:hypothetical protein